MKKGSTAAGFAAALMCKCGRSVCMYILQIRAQLVVCALTFLPCA